MYLKLNYNKKINYNNIIIKICGSKSITNRLLIIKNIYKNVNHFLQLYNASNSNDTKLMLVSLRSKKKKINVRDAGTVMRFLISYFAIKKNSNKILTGNSRMRKRPIFHLVKALQSIGGDIKYLKE
ncbi:MAG: 3-phosphoshikimate 1-carboxyvinyltransferase, partial [Candidatus Shikimatogenerans sp. JK-2022]|nr:3-phosphoshikimate 1-carboxyvinyltransferase [Candidatus Shikimatogenerans bostrichidophilus]